MLPNWGTAATRQKNRVGSRPAAVRCPPAGLRQQFNRWMMTRSYEVWLLFREPRGLALNGTMVSSASFCAAERGMVASPFRPTGFRVAGTL